MNDNFSDNRHDIDAFRQLLQGKGYKCSCRFLYVKNVGPGAIVTVVDPADANDICLARWYSIEELRVIRRANDIFWRYMI